jgi:hypothetical protein
MIRREMVQQLCEESYDLLERTAELGEPEPELDGLELQRSVPGAWRPPPEPQPPPRQRSTTATVQASWESFIDTRADARVFAQFGKGGSLGEAYREAFAEVLVIECERYKRALTIEIEALRRELAAARAQIEALRGDGNKICSWSVDRKNYRVTPFTPDGKPGVTLDLYPLFARYREEVGD